MGATEVLQERQVVVVLMQVRQIGEHGSQTIVVELAIEISAGHVAMQLLL
jgi:hypothetical protein